MKQLLSWGILALLMTGCSKTADTKPDISDQLSGKYCNIPAAVNYNWGFPGIEDNTTCIFATSYYEGNWAFVDTVALPDETVVRIDTLLLNFSKIASDTTQRLMHMAGWCGSENLIMDVDRYYMATTDSFDNNLGWQKICSNQDSLHVSIRKDLYDTSKLYITITQYNDLGNFTHKGNGTRQ